MLIRCLLNLSFWCDYCNVSMHISTGRMLLSKVSGSQMFLGWSILTCPFCCCQFGRFYVDVLGFFLWGNEGPISLSLPASLVLLDGWPEMRLDFGSNIGNSMNSSIVASTSWEAISFLPATVTEQVQESVIRTLSSISTCWILLWRWKCCSAWWLSAYSVGVLFQRRFELRKDPGRPPELVGSNK